MSKDVDDTMLMALADGELPGPEAGVLRARIAADPDLAARYALFAETRAVLKAAFGGEAVPPSLIETVRAAPIGAAAPEPEVVVPFRRRVALGPRGLAWPALAASLLLAVAAGGFLAGRASAPGPGDLAAGPEAAALALAAVPTGGAAELGDGSTARALGTFDTDLGLCRLIAVEVASGATERVVACREEGRGWQVALAVASGGGGAYLPASDMAVALVDGFLDEIAAGPMLEGAEEARALAP